MGNRRKHLRFTNQGNETFKIIGTIEGKSVEIVALVHDESFDSIAGVYIGAKPILVDDVAIWKETDQINTPCRVVRCDSLFKDVWHIVLKLEYIK